MTVAFQTNRTTKGIQSQAIMVNVPNIISLITSLNRILALNFIRKQNKTKQNNNNNKNNNNNNNNKNKQTAFCAAETGPYVW